MPESPESFLQWIKRRVQLLEEAPGRVINLATSGMRTPASDAWFKRACQERSAALVDRMASTNEFGLPALKNAIRRTYRIPEDREIFLAAGASGGFRFLCESLFAGKPGAQVLIEAPTYQPLAILPPRYNATMIPVSIPTSRAPGDIVTAFTRSLRPSTAAVILTNLHNPTGSFLAREELKELARVATGISPAITIIVDETFLGLGPEPFRTGADLDPCIVTVSSLTKTFGLSLLRCGWVVAHKERYPHLNNDWVQFESIGSKVLEALGVLAFEELDGLLAQSLEHLGRNRMIVNSWAVEMNREGLLQGEPARWGCLYFPQCRSTGAADAVLGQLERDFGVLVAPGRFFDRPDHFRVGFGGDSAAIQEGLSRLTRGLRALH
jgi:aspartate/methionine/tyrosine aminotransferase